MKANGRTIDAWTDLAVHLSRPDKRRPVLALTRQEVIGLLEPLKESAHLAGPFLVRCLDEGEEEFSAVCQKQLFLLFHRGISCNRFIVGHDYAPL